MHILTPEAAPIGRTAAVYNYVILTATKHFFFSMEQQEPGLSSHNVIYI